MLIHNSKIVSLFKNRQTCESIHEWHSSMTKNQYKQRKALDMHSILIYKVLISYFIRLSFIHNQKVWMWHTCSFIFLFSQSTIPIECSLYDWNLCECFVQYSFIIWNTLPMIIGLCHDDDKPINIFGNFFVKRIFQNNCSCYVV